MDIFKLKKLGLFAGGVLFGTAGVKILGSEDAKKFYVNCVAAGLRARDCEMCIRDRVGTFGTESAVRKRGGSRNLPYLNAKPRQIPLLGTYA